MHPLRDEPISELIRIPIRECGEPLVPLPFSGALYWAPEHPVFDYLRFQLARQSVADMLAAAAASLPRRIRLAVVEGWRPPQIQRLMRDETLRRLRADCPDLGEADLQELVDRFSAPMDPDVPPPHTTGGAVDVHLAGSAGEMLDFMTPYTLIDPRGAPADAAGLTPEAEANRGLLRAAMLGAGFTNYPQEWWHWTYGDQSWAYRGGHAAAIYGAVEPPGLEDADFSFAVRGA